ncbi:hypothetical protein O7A70_31885 [Mesorhizobium sp. Cs1299R1N1]|uniref:hypothetical protein n=1 Tax=Mesorhizobium sp. Cs1299R1N1 TaxID=3015172 RepID=UPI00301C876E
MSIKPSAIDMPGEYVVGIDRSSNHVDRIAVYRRVAHLASRPYKCRRYAIQEAAMAGLKEA